VVTSSTAVFATSDIQATIDFYKNVLGFDSSWTYGEPATFGCASFGPVSIMFALQPDLATHMTGHQHWINVDDADELYALHLERGAKIVDPIEDKPWNHREYTVEDPNGYHLRFAGPINHQTKSTPFPQNVTIERRLPTTEEYAKIAGPTFYRDAIPPDVLANSWNGAVAMSENEAIGMVRIMHDGPGWFSIWDVAVLPEWQGQRIGQKLMEEALAVIRDDSPGAWVYLFTYKPDFYARLGFSKENVSMRKV
jgi:ribosomal protein S18 acetylase RimI-like enzyme